MLDSDAHELYWFPSHVRLDEDLSIMEPLTPTTDFEDTSDAISEDQDEDGIASRWWEAEAQNALETTTSVKDIQLICKYVPFSNPKTGILALSKQWKPRLDTLLISAHVKSDTPWSPQVKMHEWSPSHVAESIVGLLMKGQRISTVPRRRRCWTPPSPNSPVSAEEIAESLDNHFCFLFQHVCSTDWIKAALGYNTAAVTSLLSECLETRMALYQWYEHNILPAKMYESVKENLHSRNPLAYWTASDDINHPSEALHPMLHCFHILSARWEGDFICWVRQVAVVAERFYQNFRAINIDWNKNLLSGSTLLNQIKWEDLAALASGINKEDSAEFRALKSEDFLCKNGVLDGLAVRWQTLSENARAFAIVDSDTGELIGQLAKRLYALRDYQSMTALLMGLQDADVYPLDVSFALLDPDSNFANYRAQWVKRPGIPFLFPHVREIQYTKDRRKVDDFLESWSFQREEQRTSNQGMIYNYVGNEGPLTLAQGFGECLNCFRCF